MDISVKTDKMQTRNGGISLIPVWSIIKRKRGSAMNKIFAIILAATMLLTCFALPCMADNSLGIDVEVNFNTDTKMISIEGAIENEYYDNWVTYYLLYPGKTQEDISAQTAKEPVVAQYGQLKIGENKSFSDSFRCSGKPGEYTLYVTAGNSTVVKTVDTRTSAWDVLYALDNNDGYKAPTGTTVKDIFFEKVEELPDEMPVVEPAKIKGTKQIFVSVNDGDDSTADGSITKPYKTITAALAAHPAQSDMILYLRGGTYPMSDGLVLDAVRATKEKPFIVTNYNNEEVVVVGGKDIDGERFESLNDSEVIARLNPAVIDKIKVIDLAAEYGMTKADFGEITTSFSPVLFVGGNKYTIARWPNSTTTKMRLCTDASLVDNNGGTSTTYIAGVPSSARHNGVIDSGPVSGSSLTTCGAAREYSKRATQIIAAGGTSSDKGIEFCVEDITPFSWVNTGDIWMYGSFYEEWDKKHLNVSEFNPQTRSIRTLTGSEYGCKYHSSNSFYYYNVLEELDAPGEWFLDKETGKLYVYPISDLTNQTISYATSEAEMWRLQSGCQNVVINGISFKDASGTAIYVTSNSTENILFQNLSFENVNKGIVMTAAHYSGVINSSFKNIAGKGVDIVGGATSGTGATKFYNLIPHRSFIQNNKFYNTKGISIRGIGCIVSHNLLSNNIGQAITLGKHNECVIEYNEIVGGPRVTLDSGAIYCNGNNQFNRGTHIRYNYIHDMGSDAPYGIYFDDMLSECYAYGNIVEGKIFTHNGSENVFYNNIVMNHPERSIHCSPNYFTADGKWETGALKYGTFSKLISSGEYGFNTTNGELTGAYATRYPFLKTWAELMHDRIADYEVEGTADSEKSKYGEYYLDQYLRASRDLYVANNVLINTAPMTVGQNDTNGITDGIIRTVYEDNESYTLAASPFATKDFGDETAYDAIRGKISTFETIPYAKIGLLDAADYYVNKKATAINPANTTEQTVSKSDLSLTWSAVEGAQLYTVQLAIDKAFETIIEQADTVDMSYAVDESLLSDDTVYYWRVITTPKAKCSTGIAITSETFMFKTDAAAANAAEHNLVGVTAYKVVDASEKEIADLASAESFSIKGYAYNLADEQREATIYAACYDALGKLITLKSENVTIGQDSFSEVFDLKVKASGTKMIKFFVWSQDGTMIPYSFTKIIK